MGFFDSLANTLRDIGTSSVRVVTDFGLDAANFVTLNKFDDTFDGIKEKMRHAGIMNAAEAIEKRQFSELAALEVEVSSLQDQLQRSPSDHNRLIEHLNGRIAVMSQLSRDVERLAELDRRLAGIEESLTYASRQQPALAASDELRKKISDFLSRLEKVRDLSTRGIHIGMAVNSLPGTIAKWNLVGGAIGKAASVAKFTRLAKLLRVGKASGVAAVATELAAIGLSVAELKEREAMAREEIPILKEKIAEAEAERRMIETKIRETDDVISSILNVHRVTEAEWPMWVTTTEKELSEIFSDYMNNIRKILGTSSAI